MELDKVKAMVIWERLKRDQREMDLERRLTIITRLQAQKHKKGVDPEDWHHVNNNLLIVAEFDLNLCQDLGLYVEYTSIIRPMLNISKTDIHADKRAYDRTLRGWSGVDAAWYAELVNSGLSVGAVSRSDGKERESVFEDDVFKDGKQVKWKHLHFQCHA